MDLDSPDQIVGITTDQDFDADGVPDSLDNAPETYNPEQVDTDGDMYGNICDADFDNDNVVSSQDKMIFRQSYNKSEGEEGYNPNCDMFFDGTVNSADRAKFRYRINTFAPYYIL